jgi:hypothetical protein
VLVIVTLKYSHKRTHRNYRLLCKVWDVLCIEDKPGENQGHRLAQTQETPEDSQLFVGNTELEGIPESCCLRKVQGHRT